MSQPKQVIVFRRDLRNTDGFKLRAGKIGAQTGHAAMMWLAKRIKAMRDVNSNSAEDAAVWVDNRDDSVLLHGDLYFTAAEAEWLLNGNFKKIVLGCDSEEELNDLCDGARLAGLAVETVVDNGETEFGGEQTPTCIAIGPDYPEKIDAVTGHLKPL